MGFIERRPGEQGYRARDRDPLGRQHSRTFARKADASASCWRWKRTRRGGGGSVPAAPRRRWGPGPKNFLQLARRLSPTTVQTYRRDLDRYVLPRFGDYRIGRLPADEIENWLNDEVVAGIAPSSVHRHYRTLRRVLQVADEKQRLLANPCDGVEPPRVPKREMTFLSWEQVVELAEAHSERFQALVYLAVDSGMRWSELVGLRRSRVDLRNRKVDHRAAGPAGHGGVAAKWPAPETAYESSPRATWSAGPSRQSSAPSTGSSGAGVPTSATGTPRRASTPSSTSSPSGWCCSSRTSTRSEAGGSVAGCCSALPPGSGWSGSLEPSRPRGRIAGGERRR